MNVLGIDVGGSGIKAAPVETATGALEAERRRVPTPQPATPAAVAEVVRDLTRHYGWKGPVGCALPGVVHAGVVWSAANMDSAWIGTHAQRLLSRSAGCAVLPINDADAAGLAEMSFGAGRGRAGVVFALTFGTGIGSALFVDGRLVPNTELGHVELRGKDAERRCADRVRRERKLSWKRWARRVSEYLHYLEFLFSPDLFILGGGVSRKHRKFVPRLEVRTPVLPAKLRNDAGIVGAALAVRNALAGPG